MGGCVENGGLKLGSIMNQEVCWMSVKLSLKLKKKIEKQLVLIFTGKTRLAKNLLQVNDLFEKMLFYVFFSKSF